MKFSPCHRCGKPVVFLKCGYYKVKIRCTECPIEFGTLDDNVKNREILKAAWNNRKDPMFPPQYRRRGDVVPVDEENHE